MKKLPEIFLESLNGIPGFDREAFENIHEAGEQVTSIRINPGKTEIVNRESSIVNRESSIVNRQSSFEDFKIDKENNDRGGADIIHNSRLAIDEKVPWCDSGYYLSQRPSFTFDPLFHAGLYYVQEASGMFLEQALKQISDLSIPLKVLDLCAAPGGKSTHIQSLISSESLLVSNEVIKNRVQIMVGNIIKWGSKNVIVTNNDPSAFQKLEGYFDIMVVDAPCSGSGLFRRDEEAVDEWSLNNVQLCSQRQKRILADALPALKQNGLLLYSTCSYSREEDEDIADWLVEDLGMENVELKVEQEWKITRARSVRTGSIGYRFYPDQLKGEGLFLACFKKKEQSKEPRFRQIIFEKPSTKEKAIIESWLIGGKVELIRENNYFFGLPPSLLHEYQILKGFLNVRYKGVGIGQVMKEKLIPDHSLALSTVISNEIPFNDLSYENAIKYLQRQEPDLTTTGKGWQLVRYQKHNLGWINVLSSRINNYYPKEFRILKRSNDSSFEKY